MVLRIEKAVLEENVIWKEVKQMMLYIGLIGACMVAILLAITKEGLNLKESDNKLNHLYEKHFKKNADNNTHTTVSH